ncbi:MAG: hypothetical protein VX938_11695, partial [Myxococcota bacterium]|nr:hypothetical protein [Myxococcota bacterium]
MRLITLQNTTTRTLALAFAATALILAGCDGETGDTSTGESASLETATMGLSVVPKQSCFEDIQKAPAGCATEKALVKRAAGACGEANSTLED